MTEDSPTNQSANNTVRIYGDNATAPFTCLGLILSGWIIISNVFVLICFLKHRNSLIKSTFTMQILTLGASDLLVGLLSLPVYMTGFTSNVYYELCSIRFILFLSAQAVEQFHILGICVHRLFIVLQATAPLGISKKSGFIITFSITSWIIILGTFGLPYKVWGNYRRQVYICSLNEMFQDNYKAYLMYTFLSYVVPSTLINSVYIAGIAKLSFCSYNEIQRTMHSLKMEHLPKMQASNSEISIMVKQSFSRTQLSPQRLAHSGNKHFKQEKVEDDIGQSTTVCEKVSTQDMNGKATCDDDETVIRLYNIGTNELPRHEIGGRAEIEPKQLRDGTTNFSYDRQSFENYPKNQPYRRSFLCTPTLKSQRKALTTIGLVLCVYDVCVIPFLVLCAVEISANYEMPRNWKLLGMMWLTVNSAVNPLIYTWKFACFRKALQRTFLSMWCKLC